MKKYYLIEEVSDDEYKQIDSSYSLSHIKYLKERYEKVYHKTGLKIMGFK